MSKTNQTSRCSTKAADATMFQFEQWARNAVPQFSAAGKHVRDGHWSYNHNIVEIMWQCWRAALEVADTRQDTGALIEALKDARKAIASLYEDTLGMVMVPATSSGGNGYAYPIRDELLAKLDAALAGTRHD